MFSLGFELDSNRQLVHIGLNSSDTTGYETPATLKDALKDLSVQNPCIVFSHLCDDENFKSSLTQWEIGTIAEACDLLKELWQYDMIENPDKNDIRAKMNPILKQYRDKWINPKGLMNKLFTDQRWVKENIDFGDARTMMISLFDVVGNMQSHLAFKDVDLYDLFSADDIYSVWRYNNAYWYIHSGETPLTQCRVDYMEANLLRNFIQDADRAITSDNPTPGASLRFGHESVVLPFCCLMGLNGMDYRTTDLETLDQYWQTYKIFPMAANIQFVYFRKAGSDDILMLPLLNEREATLPVQTDVAPYYHWSDVRDYFIDKLSRQPFIDPNK